MYAIAQIIYGLPLVANEGEDSPRENAMIAQSIEDEDEGFLSYYSGAGDEMPAAFGLELGEFDEACAYVDVSTLPLEPSEDQIREFEAMLQATAPALRSALQALGKPRVFFLWSTS